MTQSTVPVLPPAPPRTNGFALASFILGIVSVVASFCCCGSMLMPAALAIIFGHLASHQIRNSAGRETGRGLAVAGLATGYVALAAQVLMLLIVIVATIVSAAAGHGPPHAFHFHRQWP
jgi:hypothetical protein